MDLTGLNSTSFCNSIDTIRTLHAQIDRYLPSNKLEKFSPDTYDKFDQLTISNRYFSPRNNSEQSSIVPFDHIIDPYKILSSFRLTNLIHTTDNEVLFYNSTMSPSSGKPKYVIFDDEYKHILITDNHFTQIYCHRSYIVPRRRHRRNSNDYYSCASERRSSQTHFSTSFYRIIGQLVH